MRTVLYALLPIVLVGSCRSDSTDPPPPKSSPSVPAETSPVIPHRVNPADAYGELFTDVQLGDVFEDSKTFVDMVPHGEPAEVLEAYAREKGAADFDLKAFVDEHFAAPKLYAKDFTSDSALNLDKHIERLWPVLTRDEELQAGGSLIPLPYDYVVPGGRFREVYYWDSYFTMLGLLVDGQTEYARHMVDNFAYLIDTVGFVPNGNRTYYLSRSQPPFFAAMVRLLGEATGDSLAASYLPQLEREYDYWMRGAAGLTEGQDTLRVARIAGGFTVNRYFDERPRPRPEGYAEDSLLAAKTQREPERLYEDLRAACESGWDFSARWFTDPQDLGTIRTTRLAAVDLNSLLFDLEDLLASAYEQAGDEERQQRYAQLAYERRRAVLSKFYDKQQGWFMDYDLDARRPGAFPSLAGVYPLFFGLATQEQADAVAERVEKEFLKEGGLVSTLTESGQQWDAPNGWPPLQYLTIAGLRKYGHEELAREIADRWMASGRKVYARSGKIVEKYNVLDTTSNAGGGEYPNQDGFGWSNGVFARLIDDYPGI